MKKFLCILLVLVICFCAAACTKEKKENNKENNEQDAVQNHPEFLYSNTWLQFDGSVLENISFNNDGSFSYTDDSGSAVSGYDLYDSYNYLEEEKTIELSGENNNEKVNVVYYDENYLVLDFEKNGLEIFITEEFASNEFLPHENMDIYASQGWLCLTVLGHNDSVIQIAPYNYDRDSYDRFAPYITTFEHTNDITFKFVGSITENGETITKHYDIDDSRIEYIGEYYTSAYLHFNEDGVIDQGVFYGSLEIQEGSQDTETERVIY